MKKIWITFFIIPAGAVLLYLLWSTSGHILSEKNSAPLKIPETLTPAAKTPPQIGALVTLESTFTLPRYCSITGITATPGKGTVTAGDVVARKIKRSWRYNSYRLEYNVCGIRPGESGPGTVTLEVSRGKKKEPEKFTLKVPALKIQAIPLQGSPEPELAQAAELPKKISPWFHLLWGLLLIPAVLFLIFRKTRKPLPALSLRQRTLSALDLLQKEVFDRRLSAKEGIAGVSDLLRNYLEERFHLPASGKTTPEFLAEMEFSSAIPAKAGNFLKNFLNAADMIKFAQAPCDAAAVSTAVASAAELVKNTSDAEEEKK